MSGCDLGTCPAVYVTDRGTVVVQGDRVLDAENLVLGEGETAAELPPEVILGAVIELATTSSGDMVQRLKEGLQCS